MPPCLAHVAVKAQLDTGATQKLSFANGDTALGTTVDLRFDTLTDKGEPFTICIPGGIYCSKLSSTLLSVGDLIAAGFTVYFDKDRSFLHSECGAKIPLDFNSDSNLWVLPTTAAPPIPSLHVLHRAHNLRDSQEGWVTASSVSLLLY
jgi:hypothetical protein